MESIQTDKLIYVAEKLHQKLIELAIIPLREWHDSPHRQACMELATVSVASLKDPTDAMIEASIILNGCEFNDRHSIIATHNAVLDAVIAPPKQPADLLRWF